MNANPGIRLGSPASVTPDGDKIETLGTLYQLYPETNGYGESAKNESRMGWSRGRRRGATTIPDTSPL